MIPIDQAVRNRVISGSDKNFLVEAGAGTGKTTLMVEKALNLIRQGLPLSNLILITFMDRAAQEIAVRLHERLQQAINDTDGVESQRLHAALSDLPQARISTIHGLCRAILGEFAIEARIPPNFSLMDPYETDKMWEECFTDWLSEPDIQESILRLLEWGIPLATLKSWAKAVSGWDEIVVPLAPEEDLEGVITQYAQTFERLWQRAQESADASDAGYRQARDIHDQFRLIQQMNIAQWPRMVIHWKPSLSAKGNKKNWRYPDWLAEQKETIQAFREAITGLRRQLSDRVLSEWAHVMKNSFVPYWKARRFQQEQLTFDDLLRETRNLLNGHPEVLRILSQRYRTIMVDEFQDTDPVQAEIIFRLASGSSEGHWSTLDIEPGRLFLVGDPKQSIYRFRGADVETYQDVRKWLTDRGDEVHAIRQNFRSKPQILSFVNQSFRQWLPDEPDDARPFVAHYQDLSSQFAPDDRIRVIVDGGPVDGKTEDRRRMEAEQAASIIRRAVEEGWPVGPTDAGRPVRYEDMMIIVPNRTGLDIYQEVFRQAGIPLSSQIGVRFFRQDEIRGFQALLSCLRDPDDPVSLTAWLASPWVGFSSQDLLDHKALGGEFSYRFRDQGHPDILRWFGTLKEWHELYGVVSVLDLYEKAVAATNLMDTLHRQEARQVLANLNKMAELCRTLGSEWGPLEFTLWLAKKVQAGDKENEAEVPTTVGSVGLLTVHQSKGLEWPFVMVMNWNLGASKPEPGIYYDRRGHLTCLRFGDLESSQWQVFEESQLAREAAELDRLLYVALTRARDYLIVLDTFNQKDPPGRIYSLPGVHRIEDVDEHNQGQPRAADGDRPETDAADWVREDRWQPLPASPRQDPPSGLKSPVFVHEPGVLFHRAMADYIQGRNDSVEQGFVDPEVLSWIERAMNSKFITSLRSYPCYPEVPIVGPLGKGRIDLVVDHPTGLWIVDYKTDRIRLEEIADKERQYRRQLWAYSKMLAAATRRLPSRLWIYWAVLGIATPVAGPSKTMKDA